ncbi:Transposase DDE domain protein (plasmid) [Ralstonia solanacearum]|uniref:Transposase protein n=1 Tax=Ralstonia solanacearum IPO1609 TaxID=564066 RepID=A0A7U7PQ41_RALSL|nr:Transposase DDE domain protein [Ralstonia solanacearum]CEJ16576.1 transposase protein [Ralstonia solanacearum IPO1609]
MTSSLFRERSGTWANRFPLKRLREHDQIDWSRARLNGAAVASPPAGEQTGPNPTDRGKLGRRRHLVLDRREVPPALTVTGANRHDSVVFEARVDAIPSVPGLPGRPRCRPDKRHADKGYGFARYRQPLRKRGIEPRIARRGIESHARLGRHRWGVKRTHAWLAAFGKLRMRFERHIDIHMALLGLACAVMCSRLV